MRGAPLIGACAAFGLYLAAYRSKKDQWCEEVQTAGEKLVSARPTAVNLKYAVDLLMQKVECAGSRESMIKELFHLAHRFAEDEVIRSKKIGQHGLGLIQEIYERTHKPVNILTHCNAGWLA